MMIRIRGSGELSPSLQAHIEWRNSSNSDPIAWSILATVTPSDAGLFYDILRELSDDTLIVDYQFVLDQDVWKLEEASRIHLPAGVYHLDFDSDQLLNVGWHGVPGRARVELTDAEFIPNYAEPPSLPISTVGCKLIANEVGFHFLKELFPEVERVAAVEVNGKRFPEYWSCKNVPDLHCIDPKFISKIPCKRCGENIATNLVSPCWVGLGNSVPSLGVDVVGVGHGCNRRPIVCSAEVLHELAANSSFHNSYSLRSVLAHDSCEAKFLRKLSHEIEILRHK